MFKHALTALAASAILASGAYATTLATDEAVYIEDGQYTATLQQSAQRWRLLPLRGDEVEVIDRSLDCSSRVPIPHGLWVVTRDDIGRPRLVAPSVTALPPGFPEQLDLRACGDPAGESLTLFVPAVVLDWINDNVGSVLIDD